MIQRLTMAAAAIAALGASTLAWAESTSLFHDDFTCASRQWEDMIFDYGSITCDNDHQTMRLTDGPFLYTYLNSKIEDVIVEVDAQKLNGGDEMSLGMMCRLKGNSFYAFLYFPETFEAGIFKFDRGEWENLEWTEIPEGVTINPSDTSNRLRAECLGNKLTLSFNEKRILTAYDEEFRTGSVGLIIAGKGNKRAPVEAAFDNLEIRSAAGQ